MRDDPPYGLDDPRQNPDPGDLHGRVRAPAIFLMIVNGLSLLAGLYFLVNGIALKSDIPAVQAQEAEMEQKWNDLDQEDRDQAAEMGITNVHDVMILAGNSCLVAGGLSALTGAIAVFGAMRMLALRSYGLAMTGAILTALPCTSPCCLIGQIAGIWAMIVLMNADVRKGFQ